MKTLTVVTELFVLLMIATLMLMMLSVSAESRELTRWPGIYYAKMGSNCVAYDEYDEAVRMQNCVKVVVGYPKLNTYDLYSLPGRITFGYDYGWDDSENCVYQYSEERDIAVSMTCDISELQVTEGACYKVRLLVPKNFTPLRQRRGRRTRAPFNTANNLTHFQIDDLDVCYHRD